MKAAPHLILLILIAALAVMGTRTAREPGPVVINLSQPGDALVIALDGKAVGGLRVDKQGRLGIYGPNGTSTAITVDERDNVQIDPEPVASPQSRLTVANDVWLTGVLRVGRADAFGEAPMDPNGAIQVGRNLRRRSQCRCCASSPRARNHFASAPRPTAADSGATERMTCQW